MVLQEVQMIRRIETFLQLFTGGLKLQKVSSIWFKLNCFLIPKVTCCYHIHTYFKAPHSNNTTRIELLINFYHN